MRFGPLIGLAAIVLLMQASLPARAGLIATPQNTVTALFFFGAHNAADEEVEGTDVPIGTGGVGIPIGVSDESTIHVGDTQITIANQAALPFCSTALPCADSFTGFEFQFSSGVDITGVTVDPASAADFRPVSGGLSFSATDILVNLAGDNPNVGDALVLDLTFPGTTPTPVPEPASLALLALGVVGCAAGLRGKRRTASSSAARGGT